ncbi:MAG: hypothetical protein IPG04_31485 [Polyangiaceae bacterium]|nr:hypothetical protein [Polyangiaceae bacterium]
MSIDDDPFFAKLGHFRGAREHGAPLDRLRAVRRAAEQLHEELSSAPPVRYYRSAALVRVPYPTKYGLRDACSLPTPLMHIENRLFIVQIEHRGATKTVLLSPSDLRANAETPFFKALATSMGPLSGLGERLLAPISATVEERLAEVGIAPERVDYISYDHLHTQDVRRWLGSHGRPGVFPNAKLLVTRREWASTQGLLPTQAQWYCPNGIDGVDESKVILLDHDVLLGGSLAIVATPGHTEGNHSFVVRTPEGLMVTSENGVCCDAYAPLRSRIPGVARYARRTGAEVVLNGNTLESSVDQYISMVAEKTIAGPSRRDPDFPALVCSSEMAAYWAFPGLAPTFAYGDLTFGEPDLAPRSRSDVAAAGATAAHGGS